MLTLRNKTTIRLLALAALPASLAIAVAQVSSAPGSFVNFETATGPRFRCASTNWPPKQRSAKKFLSWLETELSCRAWATVLL